MVYNPESVPSSSSLPSLRCHCAYSSSFVGGMSDATSGEAALQSRIKSLESVLDHLTRAYEAKSNAQERRSEGSPNTLPSSPNSIGIALYTTTPGRPTVLPPITVVACIAFILAICIFLWPQAFVIPTQALLGPVEAMSLNPSVTAQASVATHPPAVTTTAATAPAAAPAAAVDADRQGNLLDLILQYVLSFFSATPEAAEEPRVTPTPSPSASATASEMAAPSPCAPATITFVDVLRSILDATNAQFARHSFFVASILLTWAFGVWAAVLSIYVPCCSIRTNAAAASGCSDAAALPAYPSSSGPALETPLPSPPSPDPLYPAIPTIGSPSSSSTPSSSTYDDAAAPVQTHAAAAPSVVGYSSSMVAPPPRTPARSTLPPEVAEWVRVVTTPGRTPARTAAVIGAAAAAGVGAGLVMGAMSASKGLGREGDRVAARLQPAFETDEVDEDEEEEEEEDYQAGEEEDDDVEIRYDDTAIASSAEGMLRSGVDYDSDVDSETDHRAVALDEHNNAHVEGAGASDHFHQTQHEAMMPGAEAAFHHSDASGATDRASHGTSEGNVVDDGHGGEGDDEQDAESEEVKHQVVIEDEQSAIEATDSLLQAHDYPSALSLVRECLSQFPMSQQLMWRGAKAVYHLSKDAARRDAKEERSTLVHAGLEYAKRALRLSATSADAHKWVAIMSSEVGEVSPQEVRIANAFMFQDHTLKALQLRPGDADLHHMLGRFSFEIASIGWAKRRLAALAYGELPKATYEDALKHLSDAQRLDPNWILNLLWLAKTEHAMGNTTAAVRLLKRALDQPPRRAEDVDAQDKAKILLGQIS